MLLRFLTVLCVATSASTFAQWKYPPEMDGTQAMVYKVAGDTELQMWIFSPDDHNVQTDKRPAVVFFFGGGWRGGTPEQFELQCRYLASRGIIAATADYRVASRHNVKADACVADAKSAVRWLRKNAASLGIDPLRICAAGGSAGGHTACCTALISGLEEPGEDTNISSVPNAMASFNPAVMLAPLSGFDTSGIDEQTLADIGTRTGVPAEQISPIHHVRGGMPPTIIFHGIADPTVPYATVEEFTRRMKEAGNVCELKGFAEAPHGFFNLRATNDAGRNDRTQQWHKRSLWQLDQFLQSLGWLEDSATIRVVDHDFVALRDNFENSHHRFTSNRKGHVAFLGGSITEMDGYRPRIQAWLTNRFPETEFTFTNAGIASTCSNTGAFRVQRDVLNHGPVDLLFVEFAVNDDQDAQHSADDCVRGMEGVIRQVRQHNPNADIVMTHFVNPGMLQTLADGNEILSAGQHERVAQHYGVSSVYLSKEVSRQINEGTMTWKEFGGVHPGPTGNQLAADLAVSILDAAWKNTAPETSTPSPHQAPEQPLLPTSFDQGQLIPLDAVDTRQGWTVGIPDWQALPGSKRARFTSIPLLHSTTPGDEFSLRFHGTAVGVFVVAGPDAGSLEVSIDGSDWKRVSLYHPFSKGLHYPRTVMFASDLTNGPHEVIVRLAEADDSTSPARDAARILHPVINGKLLP